MAVHPELEKHAADVLKRVKKAIPQPHCELDHANAWQLLIATILSAQSTDKKINEVTPVLFARYPTPRALADAETEELEAIVKPTGFFRQKSKAIRETSRVVAEQFGGEVPRTMAKITTLPGVARKTGNVVLGTAYGIASGMAVDTHVSRVAKRLELTIETDPVKIEAELCALVPKRSWVDTSHRLVLHGRYVCRAKDPRCERCPLNELCAAAQRPPEVRSWTARAAWEQQLVASRGAVT